ncbi:MAG: RnfH family protein [Enterovibrio sp.]
MENNKLSNTPPSATPDEANLIDVEVLYALPDEQRVFAISVTPSATIADIIAHCGVLDAYPQIDLAQNKVGIFSRAVKLDATAQHGDRIEIYRPLLGDPKEIRLRRANKNR